MHQAARVYSGQEAPGFIDSSPLLPLLEPRNSTLLKVIRERATRCWRSCLSHREEVCRSWLPQSGPQSVFETYLRRNSIASVGFETKAV